MRSEARLTDDERDALELLAEELDAERFPTPNELVAERLGAPALVTEIVCENCGGLLVQNSADWWVHIVSGRCTQAVPRREERSA